MAPFKLRLRMGGSRSSSQEHDSDRQVNEALIPNNQSAKVRASSSTTIDSTTDCNSLGSLGTNESKSLLPNNSTMDYISWTSLQDIGNAGSSFNHSTAALTTPPQLYDYELEEVGAKKKPHSSTTAAVVVDAAHGERAGHTSQTVTASASGSGCASTSGGTGGGGAGSGGGGKYKNRFNFEKRQNDGSLELQILQSNSMSNEFNENELQQSINCSRNHSNSNGNGNGNGNANSNNDYELNNDIKKTNNDEAHNDDDDDDDDVDDGNDNDNRNRNRHRNHDEQHVGKNDVDDDDGDGDDDDDDDVSNEHSDRAGRSSSKETIDVAAAAAATTPTSLTEQLLLVENCEDDCDCHCTEYSEPSGDECNDERCSSNCSCNKACGTTYDGNYMDGSHYGSAEQQMSMSADDMWDGMQQQQAEHYGQNESCLTQEILSHKSSKEIYKDLAKQWGITCKMSDGCRCMECQSHYFDCEFDDNDHQKTDGGLGAGTPMFLSEVMHGSACTIL